MKNGELEQAVLLWVDFTGLNHKPMLPGGAQRQCSIHMVREPEQLDAMISSLAPSVLCFEYDCPTDATLALLSQTRRKYPQIPVLMLTVYHSAALVLWALRIRVWDYIVKPFCAQSMLHSIDTLSRVCREQRSRERNRQAILPLHIAEQRQLPTGERTILKAQQHMLKHLSEEIQLREVAAHCHVSHTHLSHLFRDIAGTTFKDFLHATRIRKAVELLNNQDVSVTTVCYEVGFRDTSHFARIFRRHIGMNPSSYRETLYDFKGDHRFQVMH